MEVTAQKVMQEGNISQTENAGSVATRMPRVQVSFCQLLEPIGVQRILQMELLEMVLLG